MKSSKLFDSSVLNEWKMVDPENWQSMVVELIDLFLESSRSEWETVQTAWERGDWKRVAEGAHTLKSSCGNVGAVRARELMIELEHLARVKNMFECTKLMREMAEILEPSFAALTEYRLAIAKPPAKA